jgi:predicted methyltransferase
MLMMHRSILARRTGRTESRFMRIAQIGRHASRTALLVMAALTLTGAAAVAADNVDPRLAAAVNSDFRSAADKARDPYRHPLQTLTFFGIKPTMTVVELWPFGGWYTAILAPYLHDRGTLYAAAMDPDSPAAEDKRYNSELAAMLAAHPDVYGKVQVTVLAPHKMQIAPDGTADMVVTFRNIHNWVWAGIEKDVLAAAFRALKPGGILGVEEHRNNDPDFIPKTPGVGYVGEQYAIDLIQAAGFRLLGQSNVNRNPRDTKDYPNNVWSLPPTYADGDKDRARYAAIGESDRFTLKFIKPKS